MFSSPAQSRLGAHLGGRFLEGVQEQAGAQGHNCVIDHSLRRLDKGGVLLGRHAVAIRHIHTLLQLQWYDGESNSHTINQVPLRTHPIASENTSHRPLCSKLSAQGNQPSSRRPLCSLISVLISMGSSTFQPMVLLAMASQRHPTRINRTTLSQATRLLHTIPSLSTPFDMERRL